MNIAVRIPPRLKKWLPWIYVPVGYLVLFCMFAYWTFPYQRLEQRIIVGYGNSQKDSPEPKRMQIGDVTWAWRFPGIVLSDVELIGPQPAAPADGAPTPPRQHVHIDEIFVRIAPLSAVFGKTVIDFSIEGFGGEISGSYSKSDTKTRLLAELSDVDPGQLPGVAEMAQMPIRGVLSGSIDLTLPENKYGAAEGRIDLEIADFKIADGKTKVRGLVALPEIDAGTLVLRATASEGRIDIETFETKGTDLEAKVEGRLRLRDRLDLTTPDQLGLSFKFSDAYRDKDDSTRSLLGKPGDKLGGLIDLTPQTKQAKQPDDSYSFRVLGTFNALSFSPGKPAPARNSSKAAGKRQ